MNERVSDSRLEALRGVVAVAAVHLDPSVGP
jgi:hypothetical protein